MKLNFFFDPTEKVVDTIIVVLDEIKISVYIHYGRKIGTNRSKLGSNGEILINPEKVIFGYGNPYTFPNIIFY